MLTVLLQLVHVSQIRVAYVYTGGIIDTLCNSKELLWLVFSSVQVDTFLLDINILVSLYPR